MKYFYELVSVVLVFFTQKGNEEFVSTLGETQFLYRLAYLVDNFEQLNKLNMNLQGHGMNIFNAEDLLRAFQKKPWSLVCDGTEQQLNCLRNIDWA